MLPLDYLHALCLAAVALYIWRREPARLLLTPLMLLSFLVLYGIGNMVYFLGADALPDVRSAVTLSLILMWAGLITGIELSSRSMPALAARSRLVISQWRGAPLGNPAHADQLLATLGVLMALYILAVFFGFGKLGQLRNFLSLESGHEKLQYRMELAGQGGYLYQLLVASGAPFVSFLLLTKAAASGRNYLRAAGLLLCAAVFAGKLGTFHKVPWLIYVLQLIIVVQLRKRLEIGVGRIVLFALIVIAGAIGAAIIAIPELDATSIFGWLAYRFFEVNNEVIYQTFYVYPRYLPHTWGMNIGLVHGLFGSGELRSAHTEVASFFGAEGATFDAFFVADAWVDFGYMGVVLTALLVGFVVKTMDIYITALGKTALAVALLAGGMYGVFQLQVTSAFTAFLTGGLLLIPLLVFAAQALINDLARGRIQWQR